MSISSIGVALSGLRAAQSGLSITGHNISNSGRIGYTRQQVMQNDFSYINFGSSSIGSLKLQKGLGAELSQVRQIRNRFYDINYREENSAGNYYSMKYAAGSEINTIIGELESDYKAQDTMNDIWNSINELINDPGAIETRSTFIQSCVTFLDKMQDIGNNLFEYQMNINNQVKGQVDRINDITESIKELNLEIQEVEATGGRANDLKDSRNILIDELSGIAGIEVKETPIPNSAAVQVDIYIEGKELLVDNIRQEIGLKYVNGDYPFYEPVFTSSKEILPANSTATKLFPNLGDVDFNINSEGAKGSLKGLLISRGELSANYTTTGTENFLITDVQRKIDILVHEVVTMLNEAVLDNGTVDLNGNPGIPIFVRKSGATGVEDPTDVGTLYTLDNIEVNPLLLEADGYNRLAFSVTGDVGDTTILKQISDDWKAENTDLGGSSIDGYYKNIITDFAVEIQIDEQRLKSKIGSLTLVDNQRLSISGVSLDEELSNMMKYQHAYNAAAKVINVLDGMMDKIINGTGRGGL